MFKKPIILLVGHGKISSQKTTIKPEKHTIIFPVQIGDTFCLTAHNLIVTNFISADTEDKLFEELEKLKKLPSSTIVRSDHKKTLALPSEICYEDIKILESEIEKFKTDATSSSQSWTLYEHILSPALELLDGSSALRPMDAGYVRLNLTHRLPNPDHTLAICFDEQKLEKQISFSLQTGMIKEPIFDDNFIYITPLTRSKELVTFTLSKILEAVSKIHILAVKITDSQQRNSIIEIIDAILDTDSLIDNRFKEVTDEYAAKGQMVTNYYDFYIPDDANIIWGGCRELDESF